MKVPAEATTEALPLIHRIIQPDNLVLLHGGGIIGDRELVEENLRRSVVAWLKDQPMIQLPQSMFFNSVREREISKQVYNTAERMVMLARDKKHYKI